MGTRVHPLVDHHAYFITTTVTNRDRIFSSSAAATLFKDQLLSLRDELGFLLLNYVIMPDHVHLMVVPRPKFALPAIMQRIKGRFARQYNLQAGRSGAVWQSRYYESIVRDERALASFLEYIEQNPVKAGLAANAMEYAYSSAPQSLDLEGFLIGEAMAGWPG